MESKIKECLIPILGKDVSDDIVKYIASMVSEEDYEELMDPIYDKTNKIHVDNYKKLKTICFSKLKPSSNRNSHSKPNTSIHNSSVSSSSSTPEGKKKIKYSKFDTSTDKKGLKKGRHPCECQASEHVLVNNCTSCGRIVCEQEGSGPCLFCDAMVLTRDEMDIMAAKTKESNRLYNHLMEKKKSKEWVKAVENRNRLIKTDQMGLSKNQVFDDQNDYFDIHGKWQSEDEKGSLKAQYQNYHERVHKSRNDLKLALNFASRTVTLENNEHEKFKTNLMRGVNKLLDNSEGRFPPNLFHGDKGRLVSDIVQLMKTQKQNNISHELSSGIDQVISNVAPIKYRTANSDFMETVDKGLCLSMHQPWASLLVAGIKVHEGRTWSSDHRGRLWIAAAAKEPEDEEILACEEMYRIFYNDNTLEFPKKYPTGCLLGCVFVEDCLNQNKYNERYPNGESDSPFVFICSNPVILPIFYPMQGQHKIFSLNKDLHRTAKAALMTSAKWV